MGFNFSLFIFLIMELLVFNFILYIDGYGFLMMMYIFVCYLFWILLCFLIFLLCRYIWLLICNLLLIFFVLCFFFWLFLLFWIFVLVWLYVNCNFLECSLIYWFMFRLVVEVVLFFLSRKFIGRYGLCLYIRKYGEYLVDVCGVILYEKISFLMYFGYFCFFVGGRDWSRLWSVLLNFLYWLLFWGWYVVVFDFLMWYMVYSCWIIFVLKYFFWLEWIFLYILNLKNNLFINIWVIVWVVWLCVGVVIVYLENILVIINIFLYFCVFFSMEKFIVMYFKGFDVVRCFIFVCILGGGIFDIVYCLYFL